MKVIRASELGEHNGHPQDSKEHLQLAQHGEVVQRQRTMELDFITGMFSEFRYENFSVDRTLFNAKEECRFEGCIHNPEPLLGISYAIRGDVRNVFDSEGVSNEIGRGETALTLVVEGEKKSSRFIAPEVQESGHIYLPTRYLRQLAERYPDDVGALYRAVENADHNIALLGGQKPSPLLANCLQNLFLPPILGNCSESFMEQQLVDFLSGLTHDPSPKERGEGNLISPPYRGGVGGEALRSKMYDALDILKRNFREPLSLRSLAMAVGTNECYLKSGFRREFRQSVFAYLFEYRMQMAVRYLLDTQKTLDEIAMLVGYEYAAHFITAFKRRFRITPQEFRMRENKNMFF